MFAIFKCKKCEIMNTNQVFWKKHFMQWFSLHKTQGTTEKKVSTKNIRKIVDITAIPDIL